MKIGIIGTPGSGKTKLAKFIQNEFPDHKIVDKYVEKLVKRIDTAAGVAGSHYMNSAIAIERINAELALPTENHITCGTLIETMAYDAVYGLPVINQVAERSRVQTYMAWLGIVFAETFDYDLLYYLPPQLEEWNDLDFQIRYATRLFSLQPVTVEDYDNVIKPLKDFEKFLNEATKTD